MAVGHGQGSGNAYGVEFSHVSFSYREGAPQALSDIDLRIGPGELLVVLGANGSGKSTLAKHLNALVVPTAGTVTVDGMDTRDQACVTDIRRRVAMVFQNPDSQSFSMTVKGDVGFGPENLGVAPAAVRRRVAESLDAVGMTEYGDAEVAALSGGQKQLVAIAGALAMQPGILVLDEPGAMLDPHARSRLSDIVSDVHARGTTVVLITHFVEDALAADEVVVLDEGRIAAAGAPEEALLDAPRLRALGLNPPFSVGLADELGARGIEVGPCLSDEEMEEELCRLYSSR